MLPWSHCDNYWNTDECTRDHRNASRIVESTTGSSNGSYSVIGSTVATLAAASNESNGIAKTYVADPVTEFWEYVFCFLYVIYKDSVMTLYVYIFFFCHIITKCLSMNLLFTVLFCSVLECDVPFQVFKF